jgi:glycosyltransferase involved in cell wall biosynthesis
MTGVLFVAYFAEAHRGGQINLLRLLLGLPREQFAPLLIAPAPGTLADAARDLGIPVEVLSIATPGGQRRLRRLAERHRPAAIYVDGVADVLHAAPAARAAGARLVWHAQVAQTHAADRTACELADLIVCCSRAVEQRVAPFAPPARVRRIVNAVDAARFRPSDDRAADPAVLFYAGTIERDKGVGDLLAAFALVREVRRDARLRLAGTGPPAEVRLLKREALRLGIADAVDWLDQRDDVADLLRAATIFVFLSRSEGLSLALLEAAASGSAIVMSDIAGNRDALPADAALAVAAADPAAAAAAVVRLLGSPSERARLGQRAREAMLRDHTVQHFVNSFRTVFEELSHPVPEDARSPISIGASASRGDRRESLWLLDIRASVCGRVCGRGMTLHHRGQRGIVHVPLRTAGAGDSMLQLRPVARGDRHAVGLADRDGVPDVLGRWHDERPPTEDRTARGMATSVTGMDGATTLGRAEVVGAVRPVEMAKVEDHLGGRLLGGGRDGPSTHPASLPTTRSGVTFPTRSYDSATRRNARSRSRWPYSRRTRSPPSSWPSAIPTSSDGSSRTFVMYHPAKCRVAMYSVPL